MTRKEGLCTRTQCDKEGRDLHRNSVTGREGLYFGGRKRIKANTRSHSLYRKRLAKGKK